MSNGTMPFWFLRPIVDVFYSLKNLHERKCITHETREEQRARNSEEVWDSDTRYLYIKEEGGLYYPGELGQFDSWGDIAHKHIAMITEAGTRYDGSVKKKTVEYWTRDLFNKSWKLVKDRR